MASDDITEDLEELEELDEELDEDLDEELDEDLDDEDDFGDDDDDEFADDDDEDDSDDEDEPDEALEELEAAELEIEDDPETLLVDEAAEIREMRRDELGIGANAREQSPDEFVCTECFLVKKVSQLANKSRRICRDCV